MRYMNYKLAVVVLAAGKGVRMKSSLPKVVHKLNGIPMIQRIITNVRKLHPEKIIAVVGYKKDIVMAAIHKSDNVIFVEQKKQKGTGHAVQMTKNELKDFSGYIIVTPGDVPLLTSNTLKDLVSLHQEKKAAATVLTTVMDDAHGYGRIIRDENDYVTKIVEHKDATEKEKQVQEINTGIFCFDSDALFTSLPLISSDNAQNEIYLTDALEILRKQNKKIAAMKTENRTEVTGVNSKEQLTALEKEIKE